MNVAINKKKENDLIKSNKNNNNLLGTSDFIIINNEKYILFSTVIVLIKQMIDYCQFSNDLSQFSFEISTRLIELFKVFLIIFISKQD